MRITLAYPYDGHDPDERPVYHNSMGEPDPET